jgi:hypothetical protein
MSSSIDVLCGVVDYTEQSRLAREWFAANPQITKKSVCDKIRVEPYELSHFCCNLQRQSIEVREHIWSRLEPLIVTPVEEQKHSFGYVLVQMGRKAKRITVLMEGASIEYEF